MMTPPRRLSIPRVQGFLDERARAERFGRRDLEQERGSDLALRLHPDAPTHALDELVADVEAEADAADTLGYCRVQSVELVEHSLLLVRGYPEALVADVEAHHVPSRNGADLDSPSVRRVLDG